MCDEVALWFIGSLFLFYYQTEFINNCKVSLFLTYCQLLSFGSLNCCLIMYELNINQESVNLLLFILLPSRSYAANRNVCRDRNTGFV